jgi:hypothetical protein
VTTVTLTQATIATKENMMRKSYNGNTADMVQESANGTTVTKATW